MMTARILTKLNKRKLTPKILILAFLVTLSFQFVPSSVASQSSSSAIIQGRVVDANNSSAIPGATVLLWDETSLTKKVCLTDDKGGYNFTGLKFDYSYRMYAYKGNLTTMHFDYVPQRNITSTSNGITDVFFRLVPGATVYLDGDIYIVETGGPPFRVSIKAINPETGSPYKLNASYMSEYSTLDQFYLNFTTEKLLRLAIIPAGMPVRLEFKALFYSKERTWVGEATETTFNVDNEGNHFNLSQGTSETHTVTDYALKRNLKVVNEKIAEVLHEVDEAQRIGFYVAEERRTLLEAQTKTIAKAESHLMTKEYLDCWSELRVAYEEAQGVSKTLIIMRLISTSSAVYFPAIFAVFSVILAFFVFENDKRKMVSSLLFYVAFLIALFFIYPGTRLIIEQNTLLFIGTAATSIFVTLVLIFFVPRLWTGWEIEGRVTLRSFTPIIFSMAKRQIKRRKLRSFLTITSVIILVLAFTSLTSFGTVYGITEQKLGIIQAGNGVLVNHPGVNESFTPLSQNEPSILSRLLDIEYVSPKFENLPNINPVAKLTTASNKEMTVYGILGVTQNETRFTHLNETVMGQYLNDDKNAVLISLEAKKRLGVNLDERVQFIAYGTSANFTIKGFFDDEEYAKLVDLDGQPFGPTRMIPGETPKIVACNSTDVVIMNWQTAIELQQRANAPQLAMLSRIAFQLSKMEDLKDAIRTLTFVYSYDVYVSDSGRVTRYYLGFHYEVKGMAELFIPLVMVVLNVGAVMLNAVYERRREMEAMTIVGLNPVHLAFVFIAEAIVIGMVAGSMGYLLGLGFYRIMTLAGQFLMVREKLEWWWSTIGFLLALMVSILSAVQPAMIAVRKYTPAMIRKLKLTKEEKEIREIELFKAYQARKISMPIKVHESEAPFFFGYIIGQIRDLKTHLFKKVEEVEERERTTPEGEHVKEIHFNYVHMEAGKKMGTKNRLVCIKHSEGDSYRIELVCAPAEPGTPEKWIDETIKVVRGILMSWLREKETLMTSSHRINFK